MSKSIWQAHNGPATAEFYDNDGVAELRLNGEVVPVPTSFPPNATTIILRSVIENAGQYAQITFPAKKEFLINGSIQPKIGQKINLNGSTIKRANAVKTTTAAAIDPGGTAITSLTLTDVSGLSVGGEVSLYIDASPATVYSTRNYRIATKVGSTITLEDGILDTHFAGAAISSVYVVYSSHAIFDVTKGGNDLTSRCDHLSIINGWIDGNREYNNDGGAGVNPNGTTENIFNNHSSAYLIGSDMNIAVRFKGSQADSLLLGGYRNNVRHSRFVECGGDGIHLTDTAGQYAETTDDFGNVLEAFCGAKGTRIRTSSFRRCNLSNTRHNDGCIGLSNNIDDTVVESCDMTDALSGVGGVGDRHNSNLIVRGCKISKMGWRSTALDGFIADAGSGLTGSVISTSGAFGFYNGSTTAEGPSNITIEDCDLINNQPTLITGISTIGSSLRPKGLRLINNRFRDSILTVTSFESPTFEGNLFKASGVGRSLVTVIDCPNFKSDDDRFFNGDIGFNIQTGTGGSNKGTVINAPHAIGQQSNPIIASGSGTADVVFNNPVVRSIPTAIQTLPDQFLQSADYWFVSGGASIVQGFGGTAVSGSIVFTGGGVATQGYKSAATIGTTTTSSATAGYDGARANIGHALTGTLVMSGTGDVRIYSGNNLKQTLSASGAISCTTDFSAHGALRIEADVGVTATVTDLSMTVTPAMTSVAGISVTTSNATAASNTVSINNPDIEVQVASDTAYGINCTNANGNHKVNNGKLRTTRAGIKTFV